MTILTSSSTFTIGAGSVVVESIETTILPSIGAGVGRGRLIHPTLGTLDYEHRPDSWENVDGDVIVPPIWSSAKTLDGAANALWQGNLRDVVVRERWNQELNLSTNWLRQLLAFWQNPPDPDDAEPVQWWPNYVNDLGFEVALVELTVGEGITMNPVALIQEWITEPVTLSLRILGRVE